MTVNYNEIATAYNQCSTRGSHPVGLVVKMYEAILEDFRRAMTAAVAGDIQARTASLNHALQIIAELQSVLDHDRGDEVARRLDGFYTVTRSLVMEANIRPEPQHLQKLIDLYAPLRQAWKQVEEEASAGELRAAAPAETAASAVNASAKPAANALPDRSNTHWNA